MEHSAAVHRADRFRYSEVRLEKMAISPYATGCHVRRKDAFRCLVSRDGGHFGVAEIDGQLVEFAFVGCMRCVKNVGDDLCMCIYA